MSEHTNFDLLLYAATDEYCDWWVDEIQASPAVGGITARERRRFHRIRRKYGKASRRMAPRRWTPLKIACVAILVCMSLGFSACMCIPAIRSAIKKVFVDWYEDFISVEFKDSDETEPPETETLAPPPTTIERKAYVADLPEGYTMEVVMDNDLCYCIRFLNNNKAIFALTQNTIKRKTLWYDSEKQSVEYIQVGSFPAILIIDNDSKTMKISWQDNEYEYSIEGIFDSDEDAIIMATNVVLN